MKKSGFTLAEVLITLGIIGVVAAMTIPSLINQTNNADIKAALKKSLSVLNQAILMNVAIEGNDFSALSAGTTGSAGTIASMIMNRMNVASNTTDQISDINAAANNYTFFLNDGSSITFANSGNANCTGAGSKSCSFLVDVNGLKGPNKITANSVTTTTTMGIYDEYAFRFADQQVTPGTAATKNVLYHK